MTIDYDRVESVVRDVMRHIARINLTEFTKGNHECIENDVDAAFTALSYAMPEISSIDDTVTRRCAKTEIYGVLEQVVEFRAANPKDSGYHLFDQIHAESVMEDIIAMNEDDEEEAA